MEEDRIAEERSISEFYDTIERNLRSEIGAGDSILSALVIHPLGYPLEELVGIGRAFYLATQSVLFDVPRFFPKDSELSPDQLRNKLREIAMMMFNLAAIQGNCVGKFYEAFYRDVYENHLLESFCNKVHEIEYGEANDTLARLQTLASKALFESRLHEANLVLAYAYNFGCGVAKDRNKAVEYLRSGLMRIDDTVSSYDRECARILAERIGREIRMENRTKVFVSYSHADRKYEEELRTHLQAMAYSGIVEYWDDGHLKPGDAIDQTIKDEMAKAKFIVMLVSSDYMSSWYVRNKEFDELIDAAEKEGAKIIWVPVRQAPIQGTALDSIMPLFDKNKSLADTRHYPGRPARDEEYAKIAKQIFNVLNP